MNLVTWPKFVKGKGPVFESLIFIVINFIYSFPMKECKNFLSAYFVYNTVLSHVEYTFAFENIYLGS